MTPPSSDPCGRFQRGFTLVELAMVLVIVGVLVAGTLLAQDLIKNSRISSTIIQLRGVEGAIKLFRDTYNAMPGDMTQPAFRIKGCTVAPCNVAGNGDGRIGGTPGAAVNAAGDERLTVWSQLLLSDFLKDYSGTNSPNFGEGAPRARFRQDVGFRIGFAGGNADLVALAGAVLIEVGHYVAVTSAPQAALGAAVGLGMSPEEAFHFDRKMDDGAPNTGYMRAAGGVGAGQCVSAADAGARYNGDGVNRTCFLYVRIGM